MRALLAYAGREVARRPARAALALLGVVLGVAALTAVVVATRAASGAYRAMYGALGGRAALEVVAQGGGPLEPATAATAAAVEGVEAATAVALGGVALVEPGPRAGIALLGVDPDADAAAAELDVVAGGPWTADPALWLPQALAVPRGVGVGNEVRLATPTGPATLRVAGLLGARGLARFPGGLAVAPLATAQRLLGLGARISAVHVVVAPGHDVDAVAAALGRAVGPGQRVQRPAERGAVADASLRSSDAALAAVSLMALVAAVFVIWNAVGMNLAERRRSFATMRSVGATRRQLVAALLVEAALVGIVGAALGVALGLAAARGVATGIGGMMGVELPTPSTDLVAVALGLGVGPVVTVLAAVSPARRAAARDPLRDLLGATEAAVEPSHRVPALVGAALLLAAAWVAVATPVRSPGPALVAAATGAGILGAALAFPFVLRPMRRGLARLLEPRLPAAERLGVRDLDRRPLHATLSTTVLFVAVMSGVGIGNELLLGVRDVARWARTALTEDWFVRATMPESGTMATAPLREGVHAEVAALPDVLVAHRIRFDSATLDGVPVIAIAHTFEGDRGLDLAFQDVLGDAPPEAIGPGDAVLGSALAHDLGLRPGATVHLGAREGVLPLRVVATTTEYVAGGHALYVAWETSARAFGARGPDAVMVRAKPGRREALGAALSTLAAREGLLLQSNADLHHVVDERTDAVVGLLWTVLAVVFVVSSLGVVNTLTTNVLDRAREIAVLRAVGMTRGQVARTVLAQAVGMAVLAVGAGVPAGIGASVVLHAAVEPVRGVRLPFAVVPGVPLVCAGIALVVAVLAALLPGRRAAHASLAPALRAE